MTQIDSRMQEEQEGKGDRVPRLRFAPSPTGFLHIGAFRTALFNWLHARHTGGTFVLRIEDTDTVRTVEGAVDDFIAGLQWLGMDFDEGPIVGGPYGPYYQIQRASLYRYYADKLIETGHAYRCYCTPERLTQMRKDQEARKLPPRYDRRCRFLTPDERAANEAAGLTWTIRFAMPLDGETVVQDAIHGAMVFKNTDLDDHIILKSNGLAVYHLAYLVDDHFMHITHTVRAEEWISSSPRHIQMYKALGWEPPLLYQVPDVLGKDKKKLSKRRGAPSWSDFKNQGYLPEAVLNYMALMGWSYDDKTEIFTREELIRAFTLDRVGISSGIYDPDKLLWMNGLYIRRLSLDELTQRTVPFLERPAHEHGLPDSVQRPLDLAYTTRVLALEQERLKTLGEAAERIAFFYTQHLSYDTAMLVQKGMDAARTRHALQQAYTLLSSLEQWEHAVMEPPMRELATHLEVKTGQLFGAVRVAVSGSNQTPPLFQMMEVLGRDISLARMTEAIERLA